MKRRPQILVVDDDLAIIKFLRANLEAEGYETLTAMDGAEALQTIEMELPDLVILDIIMPKVNGFEVCQQLREWSQIPIIMLSARGDEADKVKCLELGADDYISKPFGVEELIARVRAMFRRTILWNEHPKPALRCHDLVIDFTRYQVTRGGHEVNLTATEFRLISYLAHNANRILTLDQILKVVWGEEYIAEAHLVHVNIARLRQKLEDNARKPRYILTKPGIGYMMSECKSLSEIAQSWSRN